jgi:hypothetical protein
MVKVISFSLWGNQSQYTIGAIRNAELAKIVYPEFECWFYIHKESVPINIVNELSKIANVKIIFKYGDINTLKPRTWRYEAIDEPSVEVMLSRDTDTRIWDREVIAVREWLNSDKIFHIMRDHPHHNFIVLAGMFGTKKINNLNWKENLNNYIIKDGHFYDQDFLKEIVYPLVKDSCLIHASFHKYEINAKSFPIPFNQNYNFVGEYVYADDSRSLPHIDILKNSL